MATQFYKTVDEWQQLKDNNRAAVNQKIEEHNKFAEQDFDSALNELKSRMSRLGVNAQVNSVEARSTDRAARMKFIQENNIKHGSDRWFKVMYARPELTGEDPYADEK